MWYIQTTGYYSDIKRNQVLIHVTTRMNLKNIMPRKTGQTETATYCVIPSMSRTGKPIQKKANGWLPGLGKGRMGTTN